MNRPDIEQNSGSFEANGLEGSFFGGFEGVVPGEGEGDGEAGFDEGEGAVVGEEEAEAGREGGIGGFFDGGAHVADGV